MAHPTNNPAHFHPFPTAHLGEQAIYDEVRPDPTQAPTGMTLAAGMSSRKWIDEFGVEQSHPPTIEYRPADAGHGGHRQTTVHVDTVGTRTYTQTIVWNDRFNSMEKWTTRVQDSVGPVDFTLDWLVVEGTGSIDPPGPPGTDTGLSGTGAGKQCLEYNQERFTERESFADTYAHCNPTAMGAGQAQARDPDAPWGGIADNYSRRRVYGGVPMHYLIDEDAGLFEAGGKFVDFDGDGTAATDGTVGHSNQGQTAARQARVWTPRRFFQRNQINYKKGSLTNSACIHRTDYWMYSPIAWCPRGVSGPIVSGMAHNQSMKPLFFTKGFIIDLADPAGAASAVDVDSFVAFGGDTFAPSGPGVFWAPAWTQTTHEIFLESADPFTTTNVGITAPGSPYRAAVVYDPVNNIGIAHACKLDHAQIESGRPKAKIDGRPQYLTMFRFINPDTTGSVTQGYADNIACELKSEGIRPAGWLSMTSITVVGTLVDIIAALDEVYAQGLLDIEPAPPPDAMTIGTIFPTGSATPAPIGVADIVLITGDSQCSVGDEAYLRADQNPELAKFNQETPL